MFYEFLIIGSNKFSHFTIINREVAVFMCAWRRTSLMDFKNLYQLKFNLFL